MKNSSLTPVKYLPIIITYNERLILILPDIGM